MSCYLLYDHFDHLLDELQHAQRTHPEIQAYVKLLEQHTERDGRITLESAIVVTWIALTEGIIHAARMLVDRLELPADDPQRERHAERHREQGREARAIVMRTLHDWGVPPDLNLLLTAGLREDLTRLETTQLLWEVGAAPGMDGDRQLVPLAW
ncbi:MAG TPA: hypothetical protein VFZ66_27405 [Herpetosiphonaceae bacterium]